MLVQQQPLVFIGLGVKEFLLDIVTVVKYGYSASMTYIVGSHSHNKKKIRYTIHHILYVHSDAKIYQFPRKY